MSENNKTTATSSLEYDPRWGTRQPGEVAALIGAGDPNEIVADEGMTTHPELESN